MAPFRTCIPVPETEIRISHEHNILTLGSCFAEHIGDRLDRFKFKQQLNPFGILYNPASIRQSLQRLMSGKDFQAADLFRHQELWHSAAHHGRFSHPDPETALRNINVSFALAREMLSRVDLLLLTFGTAYIFEDAGTGLPVANCHKLPADRFHRRRLTVEEITASLAETLTALKDRRPDLQVIVTVSPVRHLRDGLIGNQRSKATLLLAIDKMQEQLKFLHYFPSYELVLDDLRDYRFFHSDMIHPNETAVEYVWEFFQQTYFDESTMELIKRIEKISRALGHRPFHPSLTGHQTFLKDQLLKIEAMESEYPFLNFEKERSIIEGQLN